jgi:hypothetical protein
MISIIGLVDQFLQNLLVHIREFLDGPVSFAGCRFARFLKQWAFVAGAQRLGLPAWGGTK